MVNLTREDRAEMMRAHLGIVTALIDDDVPAATRQISSLTNQQIAASGGDVSEFTLRMAKQVEAGARVTRHLLMSLAPRLGLSEAEANEVFASTYNDPQFVDSLPE